MERKISNKIISIISPHWEAHVRRSLEKLKYLRPLFVYSRHYSAFLSVALEAFSHHRGHVFVLPEDFTASKGFTLSLGGYTLTAHSMSVFLLSVSFPYLGGVITFQVGRVTILEGYNNIWRVRGRFDRGVRRWEGGPNCGAISSYFSSTRDRTRHRSNRLVFWHV